MYNPDFKIKVTNSEKGIYAPEEIRERPEGPPKTEKDFKKVMETGEKDEEQKNQKNVKPEGEIQDENHKAEVPTDLDKTASIFDLSKKSTALKSKTPKTFNPDAEKIEIPVEKKHSRSDSNSDTQVVSKADSVDSTLSEQPDTAQINPAGINLTGAVQAQNIPTTIEGVAFETAPIERPIPKDMQSLISQLIDKLNVAKTTDKVDTTFTIKNIEMFKDVQVTVTTYKTAPGEFNLTFSNLTQSAKNILDLPLHQDALKLALEQRGLIYHMIVTTTEAERPVIESEAAQQGFARKGDEEQQQQQQQEKRQDA